MILRPAKNDKIIAPPKCWSEFAHGQEILNELNQMLVPQLRKAFGYHLLKLGCLSGQIDTSACLIKHQFTLAQHLEQAQVQAELTALPLQNHSIDCVVMSQVLDFSSDPHQILREVNRVLIANGHLIYIGLNPFSFTGVRRLLPWDKGNPLKQGRYFALHRVQDWFQLLGLEVVEVKHLAYAGFYRKEFAVLRQWQKFAERFLPWSGSLYVLVAKKREIPLSLSRPKWKLKPNLTPAKVSLFSKN